MNKAPDVNHQITIETDQWGNETVLAATVDQVVQVAIAWLIKYESHQFPQAECELSLLFTDDASIQIINAQWRDIDKATNVLSFPSSGLGPGDMPLPIFGDLVFAYETIAREAQELHKPFEDHFRHLIVHGFLHLLGYDHIDDQDAHKMEAIEASILATFGLSNPYEDVQ